MILKEVSDQITLIARAEPKMMKVLTIILSLWWAFGVPDIVSCYDQQNQVVGNGFISGVSRIIHNSKFMLSIYFSPSTLTIYSFLYTFSILFVLIFFMCYMLLHIVLLQLICINGLSLQGASVISAEMSAFDNLTNPTSRSDNVQFNLPDSPYVPTVEKTTYDSLDVLVNDGLHSQDSFGRWINQVMADPPGSVEDPALESSSLAAQNSFASPSADHLQSSVPHQIFNITDLSPAWAFSNEKTKVFLFALHPILLFMLFIDC